MKKTLITIVATVLLCCCLIGTTYAWLVTKTEPIKNTFTFGNINITLTETDATNNAKEFKVVPGATIDKDPTVTVKANSEACWLFIKVEKSANFDTFMTYAMADGWTVLDAVNAPGVFYRQVASLDADQKFAVLEDNKVDVKTTVTKADVDSIGSDLPALTFTAYAVQLEGFDTTVDGVEGVIRAWNEAKALDTTNTQQPEQGEGESGEGNS